MRRAPRLVGAAVAAGLCAAGPASAALPRATADRPDDAPGAQVHVLYVVPRDGADRGLDTDGTIARSLAAAQGWLVRETGGRGLAIDTAGGQADVTFFRLATDDAAVAARGMFVLQQIEEELYRAGFTSPTKLYTVFYDGGSTWSCGGGDPQPTFRGAFAALYLRGTPPGAPPCSSNPLGGSGPRYFEFAFIHEILHTLGFVSSCAPHARNDYPAGHVSDGPFDLMWSGPEPWGTYLPDQMRLDIGHDDYYGHGRANCPDLSNSPYLAAAAPVAIATGGGGRGAVNVGDAAVCPPDCTTQLARGATLRLRALPDNGSVFAGWSGGCAGTGEECELAVTGPTQVAARFERQRYRFDVAVRGAGRVRVGSRLCARRCSNVVEHGSTLVLRAVPARGTRFLGWSGRCRGKGVCRVVVTEPGSVVARFGR
jgi:hypothetical protein